jgi:pilus assembly protein CpaE
MEGGAHQRPSGSIAVQLIGNPDMLADLESLLLSIVDPPLTIRGSIQWSSVPADWSASTDIAIALIENEDMAALEVLASRKTSSAIFCLLSSRSASSMRRALQAGADELLFLPLNVEEITRSLLNAAESRAGARLPQGGTVCSFVSSSGGVGVTTAAVNFGLALIERLNKSVIFVDLHLQTGALASLLNLEPSRSIATLSKSERKLDSSKLESVLTKHDSGAYLLAAPSRIEESETVSEDTVKEVLVLAAKLFDFIIVDCGNYIDSKTVEVWEKSHNLMYMLTQSISAVRSAGRFLDLFERLELNRVVPSLIINKYVSDYPIGESDIAKALNRGIFAKIPRDLDTLDRVEMSGKHLWEIAPSSPLAQVFERLARRAAREPEEIAPAPRKTFSLGRLLMTKRTAAASV